MMLSRRTMLLSAAASVAALAAPRPLLALAQTEADPLAAARFGAWGFDLAGMDRRVAPGADFYRFANGGWLDSTPIPADRSSVGNFYLLRELVDARVREIVERAAARPANPREALIGSFYRSFMDEAEVERRALSPIRARLQAISAADHDQIARLQGEAQARPGGQLIGFSVQADDREPTRQVLYGGHTSLGLPDREYYLADGFAEHRRRYLSYVGQMLGLAGWRDPEGSAAAVMAFETEISRVHWPLAQRRDMLATYNATSIAALAREAPAFPWAAFLAGARLSGWQGKVVIAEKSAIAPIADIYRRTPIATLRAWAAFHLVDQTAPFLSRRFADANFEFQLRYMQGQPAQRDRWRRGVALVNQYLTHAVGETYAEAYFTPATKARMDALVANLVAAMGIRIRQLDWMSGETKARALDKLGKFSANIGYPAVYRSFAGLRADAADLVGNVERAQDFFWAWRLGKLGERVDPREWSDTPQTVNAYYRQTRNDITFPAGILQPPFFDPDADPAINYGAIGGVIGHEISHGFDDQGRRSDGDGVLREWWTDADARQFEAQADRLVAQYDSYEPLPGARVNGRLVLGEAVADLAGLTIALEAYRASLNGRPAPVIDGLSGDQRVFLGWAQAWRVKYRDELARQLIATDEHAPPLTRVNGIVRNMDAWYDAFGVAPGDALYLAPADRVRIW